MSQYGLITKKAMNKIRSYDYRGKDGLYITFFSDVVVLRDQLFMTFTNDPTMPIFYFKVTKVLANEKCLEVRANEVGYWAKRSKRFLNSPEELIGMEVIKVSSIELINKINRETRWM